MHYQRQRTSQTKIPILVWSYRHLYRDFARMAYGGVGAW